MTATRSDLRRGNCPPAVSLEVALRRAREQVSTAAYIQDALAIDLASSVSEQTFGVRPASRTDLPDPQAWARGIGQGILEVMSGLRPPAQLVRWCDPSVYAVIARRHALAARRRSRGLAQYGPNRPQVTSVHVCEPRDGVAECALIIREGDRTRGAAIRLMSRDGKWLVEQFQIG